MKIKKLLIITLALVLSTLSFSSAISEAASKKDMITFNFVNVELPAVIKFISEITGHNFLFDERIKGSVTIIAPTELTVDESFALFTSVLSLKGYTIVPAGTKTYKIIPSSLAKQTGSVVSDSSLPVNEGYITKLIPTEHIKAGDTIPFLRPVVSRDGHISAFGPGNLLLLVDSASNIDKILAILAAIDKPGALEETPKIYVYFLENADAEDLAKVLQNILKGVQTAGKAAERNKNSPASLAGPILNITPDKSTNSLIIVAPTSEYSNIIEVVKTLDRRRKQVFVEAMIIEASIDKLKELGSKWRVLGSHNGQPIGIGGFGNISNSAIQSIISGLTGFSGGGMGNFLNVPVSTISSNGTISTATLTAPGFAALFSLNDFRDAVNVLSTPQILTSDNEEAEIIVGENVPFISKRERDVTNTNTVLNSIERKDVGITLRITPQITEGDYVKLDLYQEISALKESTENILVSVGPTTTVRSTKTTVVVKDAHTVVIGGLMQERDEEGIASTPVLGDIPVVGWLFKVKNTAKTKTNLLVFLSPHIVKDSPTLAKITDKKEREFREKEKFYSQDELLVKFKSDVSNDRAIAIIKEQKAELIKHMKNINVFHIRIRASQEVEDVIKQFSALDEVLYAEPNYRIKIQSNPDRKR
ncbi:MAG: hypothetical protein ISR96_08365 [Nitrospira sp.]|nr:hypothetical protein [bacterium]MBL7049511.1 hypothetical protein [Nitrospira sp.]